MNSDKCNKANLPQVLIFGAGLSGLSAFKNLRQSHRILGFVDNCTQKHGDVVQGVPVYSPKDLVNLQFDVIFIASEFIESIHTQLLNKCGIMPEKVKTLPSHITKPVQFGDDGDAKQVAYQLLFWLCKLFNTADVHYFLDAGTLLGVMRDGELIPWDDDLDFGVPVSELDKLATLLKENIQDLKQVTQREWQVTEVLCDKAYGGIKKGDVRSLKLSCKEEVDRFPMVDLFIKYPNGEEMDYTLASRGISMPLEHLSDVEWTVFKGVDVKLPAFPELYLERYYGDWKTPRKNWDVGMIKSANAFT